MRENMGWKTFTGAGLMAIGTIVSVAVNPDIGSMIIKLGESLAVVGVGHKLVKLKLN